MKAIFIKNYARHDDSLFDPNDIEDEHVKPQHKGQRYCFIAGIVDSGLHGSVLVGKDIFIGVDKPKIIMECLMATILLIGSRNCCPNYM